MAQFLPTAIGAAGKFSRADQRHRSQGWNAGDVLRLPQRFDPSIEFIDRKCQHASKAGSPDQGERQDQQSIWERRLDRNFGLGDNLGIRQIQAFLSIGFLVIRARNDS